MDITINGKKTAVTSDPSTPLLWVIRDELNMTGTKYGCGKGLCGACTVNIDGEPTRSCSILLQDVGSSKITTIEGLNDNVSSAVQKAWVNNHVPQCGYCQSGQVMSACSLLKQNKNPSDTQICDAMSGNICRCGTYQRIKSAIHEAAKNLA